MSTRGTAARKNRQNNPGRTRGISEDEVKDVEELATPRTPVIYEVVRRLGQGRDGASPDLTVVVGGRGRTFDQFLSADPGCLTNALI